MRGVAPQKGDNVTEEREQYNTALAIAPQAGGMSLMELGDVLSKSGYFQDAKGAAQAIVKVLAGRELGIGPIASMTGIHIIQGRVSVGANIMAAKVRGSGRYDYRVRELTNDRCVIDFLERDADGKMAVIGVSEFTKEDAGKANTKNMNAFPRNMLFARTMSNGVKWYCPDISIAPLYTPDELGATVDYETGEVIDMAPATDKPTATANGKATPDRASLEARFWEIVGQLESLGQAQDVDEAWVKTAMPADLIAEGKRLAGVLATAQTAQQALPLDSAE